MSLQKKIKEVQMTYDNDYDTEESFWETYVNFWKSIFFVIFLCGVLVMLMIESGKKESDDARAESE